MEDEVRRGYRAALALNPEGGEPWTVYVSYERLATVAKGSLGMARELAFLVPGVLQGPQAVYRATLAQFDDPLWCYVGRPPCRYGRNGARRPAIPNEAFLVFVDEDRVLYNWYWRPCDPNDPDLPIDPGIHFHRRLI